MIDIIRRHQRTGSVLCRAHLGRSLTTTPVNDESIKRLRKRIRGLMLLEVTTEMNKNRVIHIFVSTVKRRLKVANFQNCNGQWITSKY